MLRLLRELIRPYRWQLVTILLAMMVETAMSLAGPWPLKIIIDNVVGHHKMPPWLDDLNAVD
jgi:subfamily B ATP-binding cassette protein MsbA